jgi:phosphatidylinositol alpha 1,6-mannosyltransferase
MTDEGGPKFIVREGETGFAVRDDSDFIERTGRLLQDSSVRSKMAAAARRQVCGESWDSVFETVYEVTGSESRRGRDPRSPIKHHQIVVLI